MRRVAVLPMLVVALLVGGCGDAEVVAPVPETVEGTLPEQETPGAGLKGDPQAGEEIYVSAGCGNCHVFEPAGSTGTAGPSLDDADVSYEEAVEQIANGGGGMPAFEDQLEDQQIADVAAFVTQE